MHKKTLRNEGSLQHSKEGSLSKGIGGLIYETAGWHGWLKN
jgi:hypothetical protein